MLKKDGYVYGKNLKAEKLYQMVPYVLNHLFITIIYFILDNKVHVL